VVQYVPGPISEMSPRTLSMLQRFRDVLGLAPLTADILDDPLAADGADGAVDLTDADPAANPVADPAPAVTKPQRRKAKAAKPSETAT
jgi:hypothetical protein